MRNTTNQKDALILQKKLLNHRKNKSVKNAVKEYEEVTEYLYKKWKGWKCFGLFSFISLLAVGGCFIAYALGCL